MNRFQTLSFTLGDLALNTEMRLPAFSMNEPSKRTRYPVRALRYWWAAHELSLAAAAGGGCQLQVVDMGAEHGQMRRYWRGAAGLLPAGHLQWTALDRRISDALRAAGYDHYLECDFNGTLPMADASVDVLICLHVMEHVADPGATMREIARVLAPGGLLLAGSPGAPRLAAYFIERTLQRRLRAQKAPAFSHANSFHPRRWKRLAGASGFEVRALTGTHFLRSRGLFLENYGWWLRMNLLWGAAFPSLGSELYLCAVKKPAAAPAAPPLRGE